jgi:hypothetical protein
MARVKKLRADHPESNHPKEMHKLPVKDRIMMAVISVCGSLKSCVFKESCLLIVHERGGQCAVVAFAASVVG